MSGRGTVDFDPLVLGPPYATLAHRVSEAATYRKLALSSRRAAMKRAVVTKKLAHRARRLLFLCKRCRLVTLPVRVFD